MKKATATIVMVAIAFAFTGCATAKKKFIRKKDQKIIRPVVYTQEEYQKEFTNKYYYQSHFTYWKIWHEELLSYLGKNQKRQERSINEILSNLTDMRSLLSEPKHSELDAHIQELEQVSERIQAGRRGITERSRLEGIKRLIANNFYYEKVADSVLPDQVLPPPPSTTSAPAAPTDAAHPIAS